MRQFLKSLFNNKKYLVVVSRSSNIEQHLLEDAIKNGGIVRSDGRPDQAVWVTEIR